MIMNSTPTAQPTAVRFLSARHRLLRFLRRVMLVAVTFLTILMPHHGHSFEAIIPGTYEVNLAWDAVPESGIIGYRVHYGVASGDYTGRMEVGPAPTAVVSGLVGGVTYFFAVTAVGSAGVESDFSDEIRFVPGQHGIRVGTAPKGGPVLTVLGPAGRRYDIQASLDFKTWSVIGTLTLGAAGSAEFRDPDAARFPKRFYRTRSRP
jgi:hypothetical protein